MKKLLIPLLVGAVIGLGTSTAAVTFLGVGSVALGDALTAELGEETADSAAVAETPDQGMDTDSAAVVPAMGGVPSTAESADVLLAGSLAAGAAELVSTSTVAAAAATVTEGAAGGPVLGAEPLKSARLAGLFGSMQARDAARVLEQMDDFEVQVILGQLGNREAAAILSNLSPERAAVISRSVIRGERSNP